MTMKKTLVTIILTGLCFTSFSQTTETKTRSGRPDIPGTFVVELGVNRTPGAASNVSLGLWGSRTLNVYYQYDLRIAKSKFSVVPGIGLSMERFKFKDFRTLGYDADSLMLMLPEDLGLPNMRKSQLITNYIDIPVELKYSSKPEDPSRSFKVSIGGRIGYLYDGFTKIKYKDDGDVYKIKNKQDWNLNRLRYGVFGKLGIGNFSFFTYYNLTNLFEDDGALWQARQQTNFNTFTVGISLSSF
ncbi:MAG TPA: outer membrane beta-barrel protein [Chryseosolibacter sp.]|nr:outer membrane beta-barrel protein [Chryseosolibacter sp.]